MRPQRLVAAVLSAGVLVLGLARLVAWGVGEPFSNFTRDVDAVAQLPWYTGSISLITCMVWAAATALALFVGLVAPETRRRSFSLGAFTLLLAVDDSMELHDQIGPGHGIPEKLFAPFYAVLALLLLREMLRASTRATTVTFLLGAALLGVSAVFDVLLHDMSFLAEDGAKLLGALTWVTVPVLIYGEWTATRERSPVAAGSLRGR